MLIIALVKGVPARTTKVVAVGGVLKREEMDIVLNPHDAKAIEAADFLKSRVGGKTIALSMGPDTKLAPIMKPLYDSEVYGVDEEYILSDRKMAGSDTLATSYAVSLGVKKVVDRHLKALDDLADAIRKYGYSDALKTTAGELYKANLLPNRVFSELPSVHDSIIQEFLRERLTPTEALSLLGLEKVRLSKFVVVTGIKTTDGETGSVGPQVAEAVSEVIAKQVPHSTYVEDIDVTDDASTLLAERKLGSMIQQLRMELPALVTVATEFRAREPLASGQSEVRLNNFRGKILEPTRWTAEDLGADPKRLGLAGSPTIVGPGIETGKPPVQKVLGKSLVITQRVEELDAGGRRLGPFDAGDLVQDLPEALIAQLRVEGKIRLFDYDLLGAEIFR